MHTTNLCGCRARLCADAADTPYGVCRQGGRAKRGARQQQQASQCCKQRWHMWHSEYTTGGAISSGVRGSVDVTSRQTRDRATTAAAIMGAGRQRQRLEEQRIVKKCPAVHTLPSYLLPPRPPPPPPPPPRPPLRLPRPMVIAALGVC